jgi:hypothetical protein
MRAKSDSLGPMNRAICALGLVALAALAPQRAFAHPLVEEARAAYHSAEHDRGLELLDRAEEGTDLSREDLAELLLLRAMMHRAQRQMDLAEVDLLRLAGLDPDHELGREVHPSLRRLFRRVRERIPRALRLEVSAEREGETVRVEVAVVDDVAALTQGFRVHARAEGGRWRQTEEATLVVPALPHEAVEYWAEAVGPGGAPVATHGSEAEPARLEPASAPVGAATGPGGGDAVDPVTASGGGEVQGGDDGGLPAWPFIVGGVGVAVAAAVVVGVVLGTQPTDETQITGVDVSLVSAPPVLLRFDL